jgi:uncharacterized protein involved in outer membrane biogenesis
MRMTVSTRKKVLIGAGGVLGILVLALLLAPVFLDLNKYKPQIATEVRKATGRELVISGPAELSLLPVPTVRLTGVKFLNERGAQNPNMVEVKSVTVKPALFPLLAGRIAVDEVVLLEPKIVLEVNAEGKPNWEFTPSVAEARPAAPRPGTPTPVSLGRMTIDNGTLLFSDSRAGVSMTAEKANFTASVGSFDGPYALAGSATVNGGPLRLDLDVGAKGNDGFAVRFALEAGGGRLGFKGKLSELGPDAKVNGLAEASAESLTTFVATLASLAGKPAPPLPPLLAGKFSFDGGLEASQTRIAASDFKLALAGDSGSGSLTVTFKPTLAVEGKVSLPRLDLDRVLAGLAAAPAPPASAPPVPAKAAPSGASGTSMLESLAAKLSIEAAEVVYNQRPVRNVAIELDAKGGAVAVPKLSATLPGEMVLQARSTMSGDPAQPTVSGDFSLVGPKLRDTLDWLAIDTSSVPAGKLQRLSLKGRLGSSGGSVQVSDAAFELDDIKGSGGVTVTFSVPLTIVTRLDLDAVDIDSFLVKATAGDKKPATPAPAATPGRPVPAGPTLGLKLTLARAVYNKETISGIALDVAVQGNLLKINDVKVSNLAGARLAVRGSVANYDSTLPRADVAFNFEAPDIGRVLKVAGTTAPANLGQVTASGAINGTVEAMTFREVNLGAQGQVARIDGTLTMPGAAKGPPSSIGYKGRIIAQGHTIEGTVDAKVGDRPSISADLKTTLLDLDKLGGAAPAAARGGQGTAPAAGSGSSGGGSSGGALAGLRAFDASLKLTAGTVVSSPLRISNADIALTLRNGVLTLQHLKGGLFSGTVGMAGTIDASQPALALDLRGDVNGIHVGEMLRSLSGTNVFGGSIKVTVDGRLNANGITLKAQGAAPAQLRASMAGGAQVGGHIFMGADKALTALGSMAAGAAGGVIDNTLGNLLGGVTGQKGGVGVGNFLNAVALVLNRFINRDNPISGRIDIAGGMLTDRNLVVAGDRATANIDTRTNLAASSTDTKINFMIAEDGSAPYLIATARGPFSNLSYGAVRGTAKDPPGMVNTLGNAVPSIIPGLGGNQGGSQGGGGNQGGGGQRPQINIPIPNIFGR